MSAESPARYERTSAKEQVRLGGHAPAVPTVQSPPNVLIQYASKKPHIYERRRKFPSYISKRPSFEMLMYELLGIRLYRPIWEFYMTLIWWWDGDDVRSIFTTSTDPEKHTRFKRFMISHAMIHVLGFIGFILVFEFTASALVTNALINVYPIMLQRYNWLRMKRAGLL